MAEARGPSTSAQTPKEEDRVGSASSPRSDAEDERINSFMKRGEEAVKAGKTKLDIFIDECRRDPHMLHKQDEHGFMLLHTGEFWPKAPPVAR
jgi:hypothetical protein